MEALQSGCREVFLQSTISAASYLSLLTLTACSVSVCLEKFVDHVTV